MGDKFWPISLADLPLHLILEILTSGPLRAVDLVSLELTSRTFRANARLDTRFQSNSSLVNFAAFQLCWSHPLYSSMHLEERKALFDKTEGNWKRVLRFLQSVDQSSDMVETSAGNVLSPLHYSSCVLYYSSSFTCIRNSVIYKLILSYALLFSTL